jgi:uncharacterized membrane protein
MKHKARLLGYWEAVRQSFWFVPMLMSLAAIALSIVTITLDDLGFGKILPHITWLYAGTPEGARTLVAVIGSSMIGLAGVIFSVTIVALTLASGQFGHRVLRSYMDDRGSQITMGTFLAAFLYCLLVLRNIQGPVEGDAEASIPQLSLITALVLALAGMGVLIYFIHHTAASIHAPNIIAAVADELFTAIQRLYPEEVGNPPRKHPGPSESEAAAHVQRVLAQESCTVRATRGGYVQRIEGNQLLAAASRHDVLVHIEQRPGRFVQRNDPVLRVWPPVAEDALDELRDTLLVGSQRSLAQDAEFAMEQLVEIAVRALSPGINDPFTAMLCVDKLGEALSLLATRRIPSPYRVDESRRIRIVAYPKTFCSFLDTAYNQIRQYAESSLAVLLRMLEAIERVAHRAQHPDDRQCLAEHARMVHQLALARSAAGRDRGEVDTRYARIATLLEIRPAGDVP